MEISDDGVGRYAVVFEANPSIRKFVSLATYKITFIPSSVIFAILDFGRTRVAICEGNGKEQPLDLSVASSCVESKPLTIFANRSIQGGQFDSPIIIEFVKSCFLGDSENLLEHVGKSHGETVVERTKMFFASLVGMAVSQFSPNWLPVWFENSWLKKAGECVILDRSANDCFIASAPRSFFSDLLRGGNTVTLDSVAGKHVTGIAPFAVGKASTEGLVVDITLGSNCYSFGACAFAGTTFRQFCFMSDTLDIGTNCFSRAKIESFQFHSECRSLTLGPCAFSEAQVKEIVLPKALEELPLGCFNHSQVKICRFEGESKLTTIRGSAFAYSHLETISLPPVVQCLGSMVFSKCSHLSSVSLSTFIEILPMALFEDCHALKSISIPSSIREIKMMCFCGCTNLSAVSFENGSILEVIGPNAFEGTIVQSIVLPVSLRQLGYRAFFDTPLSSVEISSSCTRAKESIPQSTLVRFIPDRRATPYDTQ
jgi:hypothetical protein